MRGKDLFEAMEYLKDDYIEEADRKNPGKSLRWGNIVGVAACMICVITLWIAAVTTEQTSHSSTQNLSESVRKEETEDTDGESYQEEQRAVLEYEGYSVLIDGEGNEVSDRYDKLYGEDLEAVGGLGCIRYAKDGEIGYLNCATGEPVIEAQFDNASALGEIALVEENGVFWYIGGDGEPVSDEYEGATLFGSKSNVALVKKAGKWGVINAGYEEVFECEYDIITGVPDKSGLATAMKGGRAYVLDVNDKVSYEVGAYEEISQMYGGSFAYVTGSDSRMGVIDKEGNEIIDICYQNIGEPVAGVGEGGYYMTLENEEGKFGAAYIESGWESTTAVVTRMAYDKALVFATGGKAIAEENGVLGILDVKSDTWGVIEELVSDEFFYDRAVIQNGNGCNIIDVEGNVLCERYFDDIELFRGDDMFVAEWRGQRGIYISNRGWIIGAAYADNQVVDENYIEDLQVIGERYVKTLQNGTWSLVYVNSVGDVYTKSGVCSGVEEVIMSEGEENAFVVKKTDGRWYVIKTDGRYTVVEEIALEEKATCTGFFALSY